MTTQPCRRAFALGLLRVKCKRPLPRCGAGMPVSMRLPQAPLGWPRAHQPKRPELAPPCGPGSGHAQAGRSWPCLVALATAIDRAPWVRLAVGQVASDGLPGTCRWENSTGNGESAGPSLQARYGRSQRSKGGGGCVSRRRGGAKNLKRKAESGKRKADKEKQKKKSGRVAPDRPLAGIARVARCRVNHRTAIRSRRSGAG